MIPNMIGFCKSVTEIKDHAKNFPNARRIYQKHYNYRRMNTQNFVSKTVLDNQMSSKARILFKSDLRHIIEIRKVDVTKKTKNSRSNY